MGTNSTNIHEFSAACVECFYCLVQICLRIFLLYIDDPFYLYVHSTTHLCLISSLLCYLNRVFPVILLILLSHKIVFSDKCYSGFICLFCQTAVLLAFATFSPFFQFCLTRNFNVQVIKLYFLFQYVVVYYCITSNQSF